MMEKKSDKSYALAVCLSAVFGVIGIQHFYLGRHLLGLMDLALTMIALYAFLTGHFFYSLFFFGVDCLHSLVTTIMLLTGSFKDGEGHVVCYPGQKLK